MVTVTEKNGRHLKGAARCIEALVGGPVILLDAVHVLGHHRRGSGHVIGRDHAVPGSGCEGAATIVAAATLAEVIALPEQVAVVGIGARAGLQQRGRTRSGGSHEQVIHNGVLVDPGATAVGGDAVGHHVANLVGEVTRDLHDARIAAWQSRQPEFARQTERSAGLGQAGGSVEVFQGLAGGRTQVTLVEVPLAGDTGGGTAGRDNAERPVVGPGRRGGVREPKAHQVVGRGAGRIRVILQLDAAAGFDQLLRGHGSAIEVELHT